MNLLFFSKTLKGGGAERVLVNLTNELVRRGHSVTIALNENESYYEADSRIKIMAANDKLWYTGRNIVKRFLRNQAMKRYYENHTKQVIDTIRPDVIITFLHCNMDAIIKFHGDIPIIHSEHNAYDRELGRKGRYQRFKLNRYFNCVCVLTQFDQGFAKAKGLKNTVVMPNPNTFESIPTQDFEEHFLQRKNILVCGRTELWSVKGLDIAINAFANVAEAYHDIDLDIVGDCEKITLSFLKKLADDRGVGNRVHFLGQRSDMLDLLRNHKLFLLSSRTEGFPMVISEAMSQGLTCLAFERLASSLIEDSVDGFLVRDGDIKELTAKLSELLGNKEILHNIGLIAKEHIKRFSPVRVADRWERLFSEYLLKDYE